MSSAGTSQLQQQQQPSSQHRHHHQLHHRRELSGPGLHAEREVLCAEQSLPTYEEVVSGSLVYKSVLVNPLLHPAELGRALGPKSCACSGRPCARSCPELHHRTSLLYRSDKKVSALILLLLILIPLCTLIIIIQVQVCDSKKSVNFDATLSAISKCEDERSELQKCTEVHQVSSNELSSLKAELTHLRRSFKILTEEKKKLESTLISAISTTSSSINLNNFGIEMDKLSSSDDDKSNNSESISAEEVNSNDNPDRDEEGTEEDKEKEQISKKILKLVRSQSSTSIGFGDILDKFLEDIHKIKS